MQINLCATVLIIFSKEIISNSTKKPKTNLDVHKKKKTLESAGEVTQEMEFYSCWQSF